MTIVWKKTLKQKPTRNGDKLYVSGPGEVPRTVEWTNDCGWREYGHSLKEPWAWAELKPIWEYDVIDTDDKPIPPEAV